MRTPDEIIVDFNAGLITRGEAVQHSLNGSRRRMWRRSCPCFRRRCFDDLTRWANEWRVDNQVVLTSNLRDDEACEITRRLEAAHPVIERSGGLIWVTNSSDVDQRGNGREVEVDEVPLTEREAQILRHVALGLSNREIGRSLQISVETVKEHVQISSEK